MSTEDSAAVKGGGEARRSRLVCLAAFLALAPAGGALRAEDPFPDLVADHCLVANKGKRRFGEVAYGTTPQPWSACLPGPRTFGDVDGDGQLDNINIDGIFLGHGDGQFGIWTTAFVDQQSGVALASGDLDKDGYADVLIGTFGLRLYFGNPDGTLRGGEVIMGFEAGPGAQLDLIDLDGDGNKDLIGMSSGGAILAFGRGGGILDRVEGRFRYSYTRAIADFDRDGVKDLVTAGRIREAGSPDDFRIALSYQRILGGGGLAPEQLMVIDSLSFNDSPIQVAAGDVDRDGNLDAVTGGGFARLVVFPGRGDGTFGQEYTIPLPVEGFPSAVLVNDLDLDGLVDLAVGYLSIEQPLEVYWGSEDGFDFSNPTVIVRSRTLFLDVMTGLRSAFVRGDADLDGTVDLTDALTILGQLFLGEPMICGDASNVDDSIRVDVTDAVYLFRHLFQGGPPPPYPYPEPGGDLTTDVNIRFSQGNGLDLGCSFETFHAYGPCSVGLNATECQFTVRQIIDLSPWD